MVDIDKIKWREVSHEDFLPAHGQPIRVTNALDGGMRYELGTIPQELPTKRGAIIRPSKEWLDAHDSKIANLDDWDFIGYGRDAFFVLSGDGAWYSVENKDGIEEAGRTVQEVLDQGGVVEFEGIE